jgi:hypothetical protein
MHGSKKFHFDVGPLLRWAYRPHFLASAGGGRRAWPHFVATFFLTFWLGLAVISVFLIVVDPYDTGRFGGGWLGGDAEDDLRTIEVSLGRKPQFNAAVIGNSHALMLDPTRLSANSGLHFVQLSVQGTGSREQMAILRWFLRHHDHARAVALIADQWWCTSDADEPTQFPFPFWLYADSNVDYAIHLFQQQALARSWRRILVAIGLRSPAGIPVYRDYEIGHTWRFNPATLHSDVDDLSPLEPHRTFPAIERLDAMLTELAPQTPIAVVFSPVFVTALPAAKEAMQLRECKGAMARLAAWHRGALLDFATDGPIARDPKNFMDLGHYRRNVARLIEDSVIATLAHRDQISAGEPQR